LLKDILCPKAMYPADLTKKTVAISGKSLIATRKKKKTRVKADMEYRILFRVR
jgi:hypothetical protein